MSQLGEREHPVLGNFDGDSQRKSSSSSVLSDASKNVYPSVQELFEQVMDNERKLQYQKKIIGNMGLNPMMYQNNLPNNIFLPSSLQFSPGPETKLRHNSSSSRNTYLNYTTSNNSLTSLSFNSNNSISSDSMCSDSLSPLAKYFDRQRYYSNSPTNVQKSSSIFNAFERNTNNIDPDMQHYHKRLVEFEAEAFSLGKQTGQSVLEANIFDTGYTSLGAAYDKIDEYLPGIKLKEFIETHYLKFPPNLHPEQQFTPISCFYLTIVQHRYMYQLFEMLIKEYEKARASMTLMTSTSPFNTLYDIMKFYTIKINHHFGICSRISNDQNKAILRKIYSNKPFSDMNNNYNYQSPPKNWTGPDPVQILFHFLTTMLLSAKSIFTLNNSRTSCCSIERFLRWLLMI